MIIHIPAIHFDLWKMAHHEYGSRPRNTSWTSFKQSKWSS